MSEKDLKKWISKYNFDHKLFYSNFSTDKINFNIGNYYNSQIQVNKFIDKKSKINLKVKSDFFFKETGLSKWDYILQNYFNHFDIHKFSKILLINIIPIDYKSKIKHFFDIDNYNYKYNCTKFQSKKIYDLISIFPQNYKLSNYNKNYNKIIFNIFKILENILHIVSKNTIIHIYYIHEISANSLDLILLLEQFFDITFLSEYKLQDIDKTTIDIILSNGNNLNQLKKNLIKIMQIFDINSNSISFIKYEYIPKNSSIFIYKNLSNILINRYNEFINLNIKLNQNKIKNIYKKIIIKKIFTQDIQNKNVLQIPKLVQYLNKESNNFIKEGNIIYNFILKKKINKIFQFGFYNGYISVFILTALNNLNVKNKILLTIDSRQSNFYQNKGIKLLQKINIFDNHLFIEDYIYNYIPKLIYKKKKFKLIILHNILIENFQELMMEFYFALQIIDNNGFIYLEKINFPKIQKLIKYIKVNLSFLSIYYENFFKNILILQLIDNNQLNIYLSNNPNKENNNEFKNF